MIGGEEIFASRSSVDAHEKTRVYSGFVIYIHTRSRLRGFLQASREDRQWN